MKSSIYSKFSHVVIGAVLVTTLSTANAAQPAPFVNNQMTVLKAKSNALTMESNNQIQLSIKKQVQSLNLQLTDKVNKKFKLSDLPVVVKQPHGVKKLNNSTSE